MRKSKLRRMFAVALSAAVFFTTIFGNVDNVKAAQSGAAKEQLVLGNQKKVDQIEDIYGYTNANVTVEGVRSIVVLYKEKTLDNEMIILPASVSGVDLSRFTVKSQTAGFKAINVKAGTSADDVESYIRAIKFKITSDNKKAQIYVSKKTVEYDTYYNYSNNHFYQYIPETKNWVDARKKALTLELVGRKGYLATITSSEEDQFISETSKGKGWIGGTRLKYNSSGDSYNTKGEAISYEKAGKTGEYMWYWSDGPEKGEVFYSRGARTEKPYEMYNGVFSELNFRNSLYLCEFTPDYVNWMTDNRTYKESVPKSKAIFTDSCTFWQPSGAYKGKKGTVYSWASSKNTASDIPGYYVEFGNYTEGDSEAKVGYVYSESFNIKKMVKEAKPYASINYTKETLTGLEAAKTYVVSCLGTSNVYNNITELPINEQWLGNDVKLVVKGDGLNTSDSEETIISIPDRPAVPEGIQGYNRALTNVSSGMEYRKAGDNLWIKISGTKVQKLTEGTYDVRVSATESSFKSLIKQVQVQQGGAIININTPRKVDVALAVGITDVDYSNFSNDLKKELSNTSRYPGFDVNCMNIISASKVNTSGQSSFSWLNFDHNNSKDGYNGNKFNNLITTQSDNAYNSKNNHITQNTDGTVLTFYGYGSSAYSDFMLLENNQQTNKTFQFSIKEYFAADALYGTGFFFNCNMNYGGYTTKEAAYANKALTMSGYLAVLEYNGSTASKFSIYEFTNLNLYGFHNEASTSDVKGAIDNNNGDGLIRCIKSVDAGAKLKTEHDLRKFKVEATPKSVTVYYAGFDDDTHSVTNITDESQATKFNTNGTAYKNFLNTSFDSLGSSNILLSCNLSNKYGGGDFGPMTKYGSHGCSSLTKVEMSDISMAMDVVPSLSETLRKPKWRENADKFLINLNEDPIADFEDAAITAELLNRLKNDGIYYIGWCGDKNVTLSTEFLTKNDLKGSIINVNQSGYKDNYAAQIEKIASTIYSRVSGSLSDNKEVVLANDTKIVSIINAEADDTKDESWQEGKWRIDYYNTYEAIDDNYTLSPTTSTWMSDFQCDFDKYGVYKVYYSYEEGDAPTKVVIVHDVPTAVIGGVINASTATLTANVTDPDGNNNEEFTYQWSYRDLGTKTTPEVHDVIGIESTDKSITIGNLSADHIYMISLTATDKFGASVSTSRQIVNSATSGVSVPPMVFFTLDKSIVVMKDGVQSKNLTITDSSYDTMGYKITDRQYILYKPDGSKVDITTTVSVTESEDGTAKIVKYTLSNSLPTGDYEIGEIVENEKGSKSVEVKRNFSIVNDKIAPVVKTDLTAGNLSINNNKVTISFTDEGGSGFNSFRYNITNSSSTPEAGDANWSVWTTSGSKEIVLPMINGTYYIHYEALDNAGNKAAGFVGGYIRSQILNTSTQLKWDNSKYPVIIWDGDERITQPGRAAYSLVIYKDGESIAKINGITKNSYTATEVVRAGSGIYTFTVQAMNDGNILSQENVKYISGEVSKASEAFEYTKPEIAVVKGGKLQLSNPPTQEEIDEVFQGNATLTGTQPVTITINNDIQLENPLEIEDDIVIDLNGNNITGPDGTTKEPDGKPAIKITDDNTNIEIKGNGSISGGNGVDDVIGGNGGNAIDFGNTSNGGIKTGEDVKLTGGNGGNGSESAGGNGGNGISSDNDINAAIEGEIEGGNGGNGATVGGEDGTKEDNTAGNQPTGKAPGGELQIPEFRYEGETPTEEEAKEWMDDVQESLDNVFGKGNAIYNPETDEIIIIRDVDLEEPVIIKGNTDGTAKDVSIDLNGNNIKGADGTKDSKDGKPAIKVEGNVNLDIKNTSNVSGKISGGNGYNGTEKNEDGSGENGGNGGAAIDMGTDNSNVKIDKNVEASGGNGGNSLSGNGGNGGSGIKGENANVNTSGNVSGGNGGHGLVTGGNGGSGIDNKNGDINVIEGSVTGGRGENGDIGGNGGSAITVDGNHNEENVHISDKSNVNGGKGGNSVGKEPTGSGAAIRNDYKAPGQNLYIPECPENVTEAEYNQWLEEVNENIEKVFGKDNAHFDAANNTIVIDKDIDLADTIVIDSNINIDLNGHYIKGPSGEAENKDGKPAFKIGKDEEGNDKDVSVKITDTSSKGGGSISGGNGASTTGNDETAGNGGNAFEFGEGNSDILIDANVTVSGGNGGYSSKGNGGNGGSAVKGNNTSIVNNGNATSGNGGNTNKGNGGNGGIIFDGTHQNVTINGTILEGAGGSDKAGNISGIKGTIISENASNVPIYMVNYILDRLSYIGGNQIEFGKRYIGTLCIEENLENNRYVSLPTVVNVSINGKEQKVKVIDEAIEGFDISTLSLDNENSNNKDNYNNREQFTAITYSLSNGVIYIPADKVIGSIKITASLYVKKQANVDNFKELQEALEAGVENIKLNNNITVKEDIEIGEDTIIDTNGKELNISKNVIVKNNGTIKGNGTIVNNGTINNTGRVTAKTINNGKIYNTNGGSFNNIVKKDNKPNNNGNNNGNKGNTTDNNKGNLSDNENNNSTGNSTIKPGNNSSQIDGKKDEAVKPGKTDNKPSVKPDNNKDDNKADNSDSNKDNNSNNIDNKDEATKSVEKHQQSFFCIHNIIILVVSILGLLILLILGKKKFFVSIITALLVVAINCIVAIIGSYWVDWVVAAVGSLVNVGVGIVRFLQCIRQ